MLPNSPTPAALYDPDAGVAASRIEAVQLPIGAAQPPRTNYFTVYWIAEGEGEFWADSACHRFRGGSLLFFTPYQYLRVQAEQQVVGDVIRFHANFLCVETFHAETGCAAMLFNDPYRPPLVAMDPAGQAEVVELLRRMHDEQRIQGLAHEEMVLAYLKVLLIVATRHKAQAVAACERGEGQPRHPVLAPLKQLIEEHYRTLHAPSDYAKRLHMTPKALGRVVREQLGKSLTDLIRERILTHAKWQLLHTLKPVKEVAHEVGFADQLYFSRMFKKATGFSPSFFREFETKIRGGSNLSMLSPQASIQAAAPTADNRQR